MTQGLIRGAQDPNSPDDQGINARLFGGLNTVSSPLNMPFEDSPILKNCTVDLTGSIKKRKGTKITGDISSAFSGVTIAPITTPVGFHYIVVKNGTELNIYETLNDSTTQVMTKSGVWNTAASTVRCDWTQTNEFEPRLIFVSGITHPIQLIFVEQQMQQTGSTTNAVFNDATRFEHATTSNLLVYVNGTRATGWSVSYSSGTLTVSSLPSMVSGDVVTAVMITWQWMAEALRYKGFQLWGATSRFNTVNTDQSVAISSFLRDNIDVYDTATPGTYPLRAFSESLFDATPTYTFAATIGEPSTANEYGFGDGSRYIYSAGRQLVHSPNYVTFGTVAAAVPSATVDPVYINRWRKLTFNGNTGSSGANLRVFVNGTSTAQSTSGAASSGTYGRWYIRSSAGAIVGATSTVGLYIDFTASAQIGIQSTDTVEIVSIKSNRLGSSAQQEVDRYRDGYAVPIYGLGDYSDYNLHSHPRSVSTFQGRLVFGGFASNPMYLVASNLYDTTTPGINFDNFQIIEEEITAVSAVDALLSNTVDDYIVASIEFQSSLFVFTRQSIYRLFGIDGPFQAANLSISSISNFGLLNPRCIAKVDNTYMYLSDSGVFSVLPTQESGGYASDELTLKIRNIFEPLNTTEDDLPWLNYDPINRELYLALPDTLTLTSSKLFVYSTVRGSWTEYTTPGTFQTYSGTNYTDRTLGRYFYLFCTTYRSSGSPNNFVITRTNNDKYLDFALYLTSSTASSTNYKLHTDKVDQTQTTIDQVYEYPISFETIPISNVYDFQVKINGVIKTPGVDFDKRPNANVIYLYNNPGTGATLNFRLRRPVTDSLVGYTLYNNNNYDLHQYFVYVDNIPKLENIDWTITTAGGFQVATLAAPVNSIVITGQCYVAYYSTPLFTRQTLANLKRVLHWYGYFDNSTSNNTYLASDRNTASSQAAIDIAGRPKVVMDGNVAFLYNSDLDAEKAADIYGFTDIIWDDAFFDIDPNNAQFQKYALLKEPIQGIGYGFQVALWSFAETAFIFVGYQVLTKSKGTKNVPWFS